MTLLRSTLLVLATGLLIVAGPANAAPPERSPLEAPEPVRTVNLHLTGSDMLDDLAEAGVDLSSGPTRVPTGIEVEAVVSDSEAAAIERMGADVLPKSENFEWSFRQTRAFGAPFDPGVLTHEKTVRIVRADWFTTKGQGFLYVEARTTEGAQDGSGRDHAARERQRRGHRLRLPAGDEPLRRLGRVHVPSQPLQARRAARARSASRAAPAASPPASCPTGSRTSSR